MTGEAVTCDAITGKGGPLAARSMASRGARQTLAEDF